MYKIQTSNGIYKTSVKYIECSTLDIIYNLNFLFVFCRFDFDSKMSLQIKDFYCRIVYNNNLYVSNLYLTTFK